METIFCVTSTGTYLTIKTDKIESTRRLPNGLRRVVSDLLMLAEDEELKSECALRQAALLRDAAKHIANKENPSHE